MMLFPTLPFRRNRDSHLPPGNSLIGRTWSIYLLGHTYTYSVSFLYHMVLWGPRVREGRQSLGDCTSNFITNIRQWFWPFPDKGTTVSFPNFPNLCTLRTIALRIWALTTVPGKELPGVCLIQGTTFRDVGLPFSFAWIVTNRLPGREDNIWTSDKATSSPGESHHANTKLWRRNNLETKTKQDARGLQKSPALQWGTELQSCCLPP